VWEVEGFADMKIRELGLNTDWVVQYGICPKAFPARQMYIDLKLGTIGGVHFRAVVLDDYKLGKVCSRFPITFIVLRHCKSPLVKKYRGGFM
jgi:TRAP-type mannitol/chloroaromatic compound transport system substrate-binding protein